MERVTGIEPARPAWKAGILPLNYTRITTLSSAFFSMSDFYHSLFVLTEPDYAPEFYAPFCCGGHLSRRDQRHE